MKRHIVSVGGASFYFEELEDAMAFAETALEHTAANEAAVTVSTVTIPGTEE